MYNSAVITVFRSIRSIRLFKLAKYWRGFRTVLETLWITVTNIYPFTCFLALVLYSYTMTGIEFFGLKAKLDPITHQVDPVNGLSPKFNFDSFIDSFLTVFIVLTNDNQSKIYYDYFRAANPIAATFYWVIFVTFA